MRHDGAFGYGCVRAHDGFGDLNPPGNPKAKYFKSKKKGKPPASVDKWMEGTEEIKDSWWPYWMDWLQARSGNEKTAPISLGSKTNAAMEAAPGTYVLE